MLSSLNLGISALSCHGNPVHPDKKLAEGYHNVFVDTCRLAQKQGGYGGDLFGLSGRLPRIKRPNWVTSAWPGDYAEILEWQWNEVLIPYWKKAVEIANSYGVTKIAWKCTPASAYIIP